MLKIRVKRNLRKNIKQGQPWLYKDALDLKSFKSQGSQPEWAELIDQKGSLGFGIWDPRSPVAFRLLDLKSPHPQDLKALILRSLSLRSVFDLDRTNAFRLINGEGDGLSGLVCDLYNGVAVIRCDGSSMEEFWLNTQVVDVLLSQPFVDTVVLKSRSDQNPPHVLSGAERDLSQIYFKENGVLFETDLLKAQKTGFFLDQRNNRQHVKPFSQSKEVWNLFSYTGGFSVYAGLGGAKQVFSVDVSKGALEQSQKNWEMNKLPTSKHQAVEVDIYDFLKTEKFKTDLMVVDPPSMTSAQDSKERAVKKYIELFTHSAKKVKEGGDLFLSSCSSRIDFEDFRQITEKALSQARKKAQVLRVSGQGFDHPYPHVCENLRYLKFFHLRL